MRRKDTTLFPLRGKKKTKPICATISQYQIGRKKIDGAPGKRSGGLGLESRFRVEFFSWNLLKIGWIVNYGKRELYIHVNTEKS